MDSQSTKRLQKTCCYFHISGMTSIQCINRIEEKLVKQQGVYDVQIRLLTESAEINYNPDSLKPEELVVAIEELGYGVQVLKPEQHSKEIVDLNIEGMTCSSCAYMIEDEIKKMDGIVGVNVNLLTHRGHFKFDKSRGLGTRDIIKRFVLVIIYELTIINRFFVI